MSTKEFECNTLRLYFIYVSPIGVPSIVVF